MKFTLTFRYFRSVRFECPCPKSEAFPKIFRGTFKQGFTILVVPTVLIIGTKTKLNLNFKIGTIETIDTRNVIANLEFVSFKKLIKV